jgi:hypothetical protein
VGTSLQPLLIQDNVQRQREDSQEDSLTDPQAETSLQLLLSREIVRRQGEDSQEDSLTDTQVGTSLQPLLIQDNVQRQREDSLTDTQVRSAFSICSPRRLCRGRGRKSRRTASHILW